MDCLIMQTLYTPSPLASTLKIRKTMVRRVSVLRHSLTMVGTPRHHTGNISADVSSKRVSLGNPWVWRPVLNIPPSNHERSWSKRCCKSGQE